MARSSSAWHWACSWLFDVQTTAHWMCVSCGWNLLESGLTLTRTATWLKAVVFHKVQSAEQLESQHEAHSNATNGTAGSKRWIPEKHNFGMLPSSWYSSGTWTTLWPNYGQKYLRFFFWVWSWIFANSSRCWVFGVCFALQDKSWIVIHSDPIWTEQLMNAPFSPWDHQGRVSLNGSNAVKQMFLFLSWHIMAINAINIICNHI